MKQFSKELLVRPAARIQLAHIDPSDTHGVEKVSAAEVLEKNLDRLRVLRFLLYIDKEEQAKRFRERIDDKTKNWKFSPADLKEREYWDQYIDAYQDMLRKCSTKHAPWYVIPANRKWFRNLAVSQILCDELE